MRKFLPYILSVFLILSALFFFKTTVFADTATPANGTPEVMPPSEAAAILRVSEEDVIAAITSGDLKAKKLGSAYRISKSALDEFLKS